jgi:hypothetical protein
MLQLKFLNSFNKIKNMKTKNILLLFFSFTLLQSVKSQCKYFDTKYQTKSEKLLYKNGEETFTGNIKVNRIDTAYFFSLDYEFQKAKSGIEANIKSSEKLSFMLENGDAITIKSTMEVKAEKDKKMGIYFCNLNNVKYSVTKNQITKFIGSKVKSIKFFYTDSFGEENSVMVEVKEKRQELVSDLIKCVL